MQKFHHYANSNNVAFQFLRPEVATGVGNIDTFLVRSNSERMREVNGASGIFFGTNLKIKIVHIIFLEYYFSQNENENVKCCDIKNTSTSWKI